MKILLVAINAKFIHSNPAIYSLRAAAGKETAEYIELAEYTVNQRMEDILADLYGRKPDMIGFSCYIWNWTLVGQLVTELPKLLPEADIWLGGPEVSFEPDKLLRQYPRIAGIMVGEGEATFRDLAGWYVRNRSAGRKGEEQASGGRTREEQTSGGREWVEQAREQASEGQAREEQTSGRREWGEQAREEASGGWAREEQASGGREWGEQAQWREIPGLYLRTGYTPVREPVDMSGIPFLYDDLAPFENRIIYYESSRGCPYRCSYCLSSLEKTVRKRDIDVVCRELQFFLDHRVRQVKFVDRTFNCDHEHAMAVWQYIREHDNGVTNFHFEIAGDILRQEELELLGSLRPGLVQLEIGVQSANPAALQAVHRNPDLTRLEQNVAQIGAKRNIHCHLDLIAGLPFEDYESFGRSFDRVYGMRPEQLQLGFLKVLKGSEMWERAKEYGIQYLDTPPYEVLRTKWLDYEELRRLKGIEEMVELYYNSGQFTGTLPFLEKAFSGPFAMFEKLADYYREQGYSVNSPSRSDRYVILLSFARTCDEKALPRYRELLTYDLYLRENVKSRLAFARDLTPYKERIREFYRREESERRYLPDYEGYDGRQLSKMTHLEPFTDFEEEKEYFLLFDYRQRDPLTGGARTCRVFLPEEEQG